MIKAIKALLSNPVAPSSATGDEHETELQVAAAALLVEAATMDDQFDEAEQSQIEALLKSRFGLSQDESEDLLARAHGRIAESSQLFGFTRVVNQGFSAEERIELIEMLWQVVYADGEPTGAMPGKPFPNGEPGPNLYCAVIVKTVDERTRSKTGINELLRD